MDRKPWLWGIGLFGLLLCAAFGLLYWSMAGPSDSESQQPESQLTITRLETPSPPISDYVGSRACVECHGEIAAAYASHPMANSCAVIDQATPLEDYSAAEFTADDGRRYFVERTASNKVLHHESLADSRGALYDVGVEVAYVLGSGRRGRAYLAQRDGRLFQSPITWYSQHARWDLSPGYDPYGHQGFERRVGDGCLYCHVGRVALGKQGMDTYAQPAFAEATIGCERCHGPGGRHVAFHHGAPPESAAIDPIVNPAKLPPAERDAVCFVCHLQGRATFRRFGRGFFDFRPGQPLEDTLLIYLEGARVNELQMTLPVSQVEQMQISMCYRESKAFTCTSCHDPHHAPTATERVTHYRNKCLSCHFTEDCAAPAEQRQAANVQDSCIACHMPALPTREVAHTALTDHRVVRRIQDQPTAAAVTDPETLLLVGDESRIPDREANRGRGLLLMEAAQGLRNVHYAEQARWLLTPRDLTDAPLRDVLKSLDNDPVALDALGLALHVTGADEDARQAWLAALQADPSMERPLYLLAQSHATAGDQAQALERLEQLATLNPFAAEVAVQRARLLWMQGEAASAIEAARAGLELQPSHVALRELLERLYRENREGPLAEKQRRILERLRPTRNRERVSQLGLGVRGSGSPE